MRKFDPGDHRVRDPARCNRDEHDSSRLRGDERHGIDIQPGHELAGHDLPPPQTHNPDSHGMGVLTIGLNSSNQSRLDHPITATY
ncbi:hypothetical protein FG87_32995 [Nocardia vulneris]|uniref:Uncharacterized protein n=1 Tax=Nocardia vulneris TaxID=1141657 RepID=A0ABR4Z790_9NOCA|nr:hypothetical protein FG87_32995 [Nocardia vulneris]